MVKVTRARCVEPGDVAVHCGPGRWTFAPEVGPPLLGRVVSINQRRSDRVRSGDGDWLAIGHAHWADASSGVAAFDGRFPDTDAHANLSLGDWHIEFTGLCSLQMALVLRWNARRRV